MTTIKLKNGSGAPLAGDLVQGEPALDLTNKRLYTEDSGGTVIEVGTNPTSLTTGTFTSTGIDDNAASTAITIDGSQNVGINNSNPSAYGKFVVDGTGNILNVNATSGSALLQLYEGGAGRFGIQTLDGSAGAKFTTAGTERMRIDSSGNVGIAGQTNPTYKLDGGFADQTWGWYLNSGYNAGMTYTTSDRSLLIHTKSAEALDHIKFATGTAATERMRIDSSGNVGIDNSNPAYKLSIGGAFQSVNTNLISITDTATVYRGTPDGTGFEHAKILSGRDATSFTYGSFLSFYTEGKSSGTTDTSTEAMRIDASGNLLVGRINTSFGNTGHVFAPSGFVYHERDGGDSVMYLNRLTSDGDLIRFYKDSTTQVGSIGAVSSGVAGISLVNPTYGGIRTADYRINPVNGSGANFDNSIDLGAGGTRFKDLYLSGGVYLGGTGSANKLDDYEEGTWTPTLTGGSSEGTTTYNGRSGDYTKIGNTVRVGFYISFTAATGTGEIRLGGLPFTQNADNTNNVKIGGVMTDGLNWGVDGSLILMGTIATTFMRVGLSRDDTGVHIQGVTNETATIWGSLTYITNS